MKRPCGPKLTPQQHLAAEKDISQYKLQAEFREPISMQQVWWCKHVSKTGVFSHVMELNFGERISPLFSPTVKFDPADKLVKQSPELDSAELRDSTENRAERFPDSSTTMGPPSPPLTDMTNCCKDSSVRKS